MLSRKKEEIIKVIKELTKEVRNVHPKVENFNSKKVALGAICEFTEVIPSPVIEKYRNKCEFTVGN